MCEIFTLISSQYHDDGEASLGPSVASLSLGCPAKMRWRLKAKYWCGFRDKAHKHYDPNQPVLPGCRKPEERHKLNELARTASTEELDKAAQVALAFEKNESKTPPVILELDLRHGDYMVMHGASMQVYYEVTILVNTIVDRSSTNKKIKIAHGRTYRQAPLWPHMSIRQARDGSPGHAHAGRLHSRSRKSLRWRPRALRGLHEDIQCKQGYEEVSLSQCTSGMKRTIHHSLRPTYRTAFDTYTQSLSTCKSPASWASAISTSLHALPLAISLSTPT